MIHDLIKPRKFNCVSAVSRGISSAFRGISSAFRGIFQIRRGICQIFSAETVGPTYHADDSVTSLTALASLTVAGYAPTFLRCLVSRGVHPSETMMHFPPVSDFPPIFGKFSNSEENFHNMTFSSAEISDDLFFSHRPQISNSSLFSLLQYISPLFRQNYYFPLALENVTSALVKFTCFLHTLRVFRFPLL